MRYLVTILFCLLLAGCAVNFGEGDLVLNSAGSQISATGESSVDNASATDGGLGQGAATDVSPLLPESPQGEQPTE